MDVLERAVTAGEGVIDVLIVGAGIAGLSAAKSLLNADSSLNIAIVEAESRIGGRIHAPVVGEYAYDAGAAWLHGGLTGAHPLLSSLTKHGCPDKDGDPDCSKDVIRIERVTGECVGSVPNRCNPWVCPNSDLFFFDVERMTNKSNSAHSSCNHTTEGSSRVQEILESWYRAVARMIDSADSGANKSLKDVVDELCKDIHDDEGKMIARAIPRLVGCWYGIAPAEISVDEYCVECPGDLPGLHGVPATNIAELFRNLFEEEAKLVQFATRVTAIKWCTDKIVSIEVETEDKPRTIHSKHVICTVPAIALGRNIVQFHPPLPADKCALLQSLRPAQYKKVVLYLDKMPSDVPNRLFLVPTDDSDDGGPRYTLIENHMYLRKAPVLMGILYDKDVFNSEGIPWTEKECVEALKVCLKKFTNADVTIIDSACTTWESNELSGKSAYCMYCGDTDGYTVERILRAPLRHVGSDGVITHQVYFAGDAYSVEHMGSLHGAHATGAWSAKHLLKHMQR